MPKNITDISIGDSSRGPEGAQPPVEMPTLLKNKF